VVEVAAAALISAVGLTGTAATVGTIAVSAAISVGVGFAAQALMTPDAPEAQAYEPQKKARSAVGDDGRKITSRQPIPMRRMIVGKALVSGPLFFLEVKNPYLYMGIILGDGPIDGVEYAQFNGSSVFFGSDGAANGLPFRSGSLVHLYASFRNGDADQAIDPILAADFPGLPSTFRQRGVATAVFKCYWGLSRDHHEALWGSSGINPLCLVRGAKVYDPRDLNQRLSDPTTWIWSDNAALIQSHWLTQRWQYPIADGEIDWSSVKRAADVCDETVGTSSGSERRYIAGGVISADDGHFETARTLLTANSGRMYYRQGRIALESGAPKTSIFTVTDRDIISGISHRHSAPVTQAVNRVRTMFTAMNREWEKANGPIVESTVYQTEDGRVNEQTIDLAFTNTSSATQRIARRYLETQRAGRELQMTLSPRGQFLEAGDLITVNSRTIPYINGVYDILSVLQSATGSEVRLVEYSPSVDTWNPATDDLPFTISPASL
jgi:hypothetical protein